jgi:hypothetical protein
MSEKNLQNSDDQEYWKFVERTAREVRETPKWMGGDESDDESSSSVQESTESEKERDAA